MSQNDSSIKINKQYPNCGKEMIYNFLHHVYICLYCDKVIKEDNSFDIETSNDYLICNNIKK